jgi:hypothetical protein
VGLAGLNLGSDVNGTQQGAQVVTAVLPSGEPVKISVAAVGSGDGMASVGLHDLDLEGALDRVGEIGALVIEKLKAAGPGKTTVELHLGFAVEAGKLTALWVGGKGEASLTVTMEWPSSGSLSSRQPESTSTPPSQRGTVPASAAPSSEPTAGAGDG